MYKATQNWSNEFLSIVDSFSLKSSEYFEVLHLKIETLYEDLSKNLCNGLFLQSGWRWLKKICFVPFHENQPYRYTCKKIQYDPRAELLLICILICFEITKGNEKKIQFSYAKSMFSSEYGMSTILNLLTEPHKIILIF